ncbi:hypothetical protein HGRIS_013345 [Hohenbuehelia grisea]|uniref:Uridylate kinase n=1 Tax=Hohenbuehelia grisea TaxID=104357 RepID=A0ABR3IVC6_9AGAR
MPAIIDKITNALHSSDSTASSAPAFDPSKVTVIYVLGGPGAGKGTQSARLVSDFGFCHLSAGDLLRAEQNREGSEYGSLIRTHIKEGTVVPMEVTIKLLQNAMKAALQDKAADPLWANGRGLFLIDGFPRKMDQALKFDEDVCPSSLVLFYATTEEVMLGRLLERGKTSGREDDNVESIKKRFRTYNEQTMPVINHYKALNQVAEIDSSGTVEEVHDQTYKTISKLLAAKPHDGAAEAQA